MMKRRKEKKRKSMEGGREVRGKMVWNQILGQMC